MPPTPEKPQSPEYLATQELMALGLEANPENIETVAEQMKTAQHPEGYEEILANLGDPEKLKAAMEKQGISSVIHSEGPTVWDHAKLAIRQIEAADMPANLKQDCKLLMLYHDLGKTAVGTSEENQTATAKKLKKGELNRSMIGHAEAKHDEMTKGLKANGIEGDKLEKFMAVITHHMKKALLELKPQKLVEVCESFGKDKAAREAGVKLLIEVLHLDGDATQNIVLADGRLAPEGNEKKPASNFEVVWAKYEAIKKTQVAEQEKSTKKKAEDDFERTVFGEDVSDYLPKRDITNGPDRGYAVGVIRKLIAEHKGKTPEEIKKIIDETVLTK